MLHLFTQTRVTDITQHHRLVMNLGAFSPLYTFLPSQHSSKLTSQWLVFVSKYAHLNKKMCFMLRCNNTNVGNVCAKLAT